MTTFGDTIDRILRFAPQKGFIDRLASDVATGNQGEQVTISYSGTGGNKIVPPTDVEINSEVFHVISSDVQSKTFTAIRGWLDSTPASHSSASSTVIVSPRFFRRDAADAVKDALRKVVPPLYRMMGTNVTFDPGLVSYSLPSDTLDVYRVWAEINATTKRWKELHSFEVAHKMDTAKFTNGVALLLGEPGVSGQPLRVLYKAAFTEPAAESDSMQTTVGLEPFMFDIPVWYAVSVLVPPDEVARGQIDVAVPSQRAEQVPPKENISVAEYFRARYQDSVRDAVMQLEMRYPMRMRVVRNV